MTALLPLILLLVPAARAETPSREETAHFAALALKCATTEFPNKPDHVINDASDLERPSVAHPSFYGCFDWHSSVHGHWLMVRSLRLHPDLPDAAHLRSVLDVQLSTTAVAGEVAYLRQPQRVIFERTYGWAWLLKLAEELRGWDDPDAKRWSANLAPLTAEFVGRYESFLPKLTYPLRTGVHPNTAFALAFGLDYARAAGDKKLEDLIVERSKTYFGKDRDYPAAWEPGGEDFFSPALVEADLMRRVLSPDEFARWLDGFLPKLGRGGPKSLTTPAVVTDRSDPRIVHLDGLNLSRAFCLIGIASGLPAKDARRPELLDLAKRHMEATLPHVASGAYEGEHWLATYAMLALTAPER
ncbi:MAG TPA: DUF2891 domain-containing protein [Elusimicrobiota bacterium]|nr:DUF2891 domain-containing protein [Elusimicrobiota bacterium]